MNTEITSSKNKILSSVKDTIQRLLTDSISLEEAKLQYTANFDKLIELENQGINDSTDDIKGLLYYHTVMNFAKFTGIFRKIGPTISIDNYCGDKNFTESSIKIIKGNANSKQNTIISVPIKTKTDIDLKCYMFSTNINNQIFSFITLTSSVYFTIDKFQLLCSTLVSIFNKQNSFYSPKHIIYSNGYINEIMDHFKDEGPSTSLTIDIYRMKRLEITFSHFDIFNISDFTNTVFAMLKENNNKSNVIPLTLSTYLVYREHNDEAKDSKIHKLTLTYKDITIPYTVTNKIIDNLSSLYLLLWKLHTSEE